MFAWKFGSSAGALGNLLGGIALSYFSPKVLFLFFAILLQFFSTSLQLSSVQFCSVQYIISAQFCSSVHYFCSVLFDQFSSVQPLG
jgi:threonine/homoserine/homoserine lactone efflux protein